MSQFTTGRSPEPISAPVLGPAVPSHAPPRRASEAAPELPAPFYRGQQRSPGTSAADAAPAVRPEPEPQPFDEPARVDELPWMSPDDETRDSPVALESAPGWEGAAQDQEPGPGDPEPAWSGGADFAMLEAEALDAPIVPIEDLAPTENLALAADSAPVVPIQDLAPDGELDEEPRADDAGPAVADYEIYQAPSAAQIVQPEQDQETEDPFDTAEPWESALLAPSFEEPEAAAGEPALEEPVAGEPVADELASDELPAWEPEEEQPEEEPYGGELPGWEPSAAAAMEEAPVWDPPVPEYLEAEVVDEEVPGAAAPEEEALESWADPAEEPREPTPAEAASAMLQAASPGTPARASALDEIAERLEHIARALREKSPADLIGGPDPLQALIAGYALGYTDAARRQQRDSSDG